MAAFGEKYERVRVPMLIPWPKKKEPAVEESLPRPIRKKVTPSMSSSAPFLRNV